jgi:hypothetical protein
MTDGGRVFELHGSVLMVTKAANIGGNRFANGYRLALTAANLNAGDCATGREQSFKVLFRDTGLDLTAWYVDNQPMSTVQAVAHIHSQRKQKTRLAC